MKASQGQRDLERRSEGQTEVMVGRLETVTESEEMKQLMEEQPVTGIAPPPYECCFSNKDKTGPICRIRTSVLCILSFW